MPKIFPIYTYPSLGEIIVGGEPNPLDAFSIGVKVAESNVVGTDAMSVAFTFPDFNAAPLELALLKILGLGDVNALASDALLGLGIRTAESSVVPTDGGTFIIRLAQGDTSAIPTETIKLSIATYADTNVAPTEARTSQGNFWLTGSAGSGVTNPANANGLNDATNAVISTAVAGSATETLTSNCGSGIPASTPFTACTYRGWFSQTVVLGTSTGKIVATWAGGGGPATMWTNTTTVSHSGGTFTYDLFAAGCNTLAKAQSVTISHSTTDAVAGVSPMTMNVDAGRIELPNII